MRATPPRRRDRNHLRLAVAVGALVVGACSPGVRTVDDGAIEPTAPAPGIDATTPTGTGVEDYPDASTRRLRALAEAPRPVPRSALPPRHLDVERFPDTLVPRDRIVSGGPPPDGIAAIDRPEVVPVGPAAERLDLDPDEAVVVVEAGGEARLYPVRVMVIHEIVNDTVGGVPIVTTFCPLCNSAVVAERRLDGRVLDFGTSGALYRSALVMYDRQTESLWTHFDGRAVVGELLGTQLEVLPAATVSWAEASAAHPRAGVVVGEVGRRRPYGPNPYPGLDARDRPPRAWVPDPVDDRTPPMSRVVGVLADGHAVAVDRDALARVGVWPVTVGTRALVLVWTEGQRSALSAPEVAEGHEIGSVVVLDRELDGRVIDLRLDDATLVDADGRRWSTLGRPTDPTRSALDVVPHIDTFWFAWSGYHPDTSLVVP